MGQKVNITLTVQAANLHAITNPTATDIENNTTLTDDNSGIPSVTNANFISEVFIDNDVRWVGVTNDPGYAIAIHSVVYEPVNKGSSVDFFNAPVLTRTSKRYGFVEAKVNNDQNLVGEFYCYYINFKIHVLGGCFLLGWVFGKVLGPFEIDPKLKANA